MVIKCIIKSVFLLRVTERIASVGFRQTFRTDALKMMVCGLFGNFYNYNVESSITNIVGSSFFFYCYYVIGPVFRIWWGTARFSQKRIGIDYSNKASRSLNALHPWTGMCINGDSRVYDHAYKQLDPRRYCNRISLIIRTVLLFTCIKHVFTDIRVNVLSFKS